MRELAVWRARGVLVQACAVPLAPSARASGRGRRRRRRRRRRTFAITKKFCEC